MKTILYFCAMLLSASLYACSPGDDLLTPVPPAGNPGGNTPDGNPGKPGDNPQEPEEPPQTTDRMQITVGSAVFTATLADTPAAAAFRAMLPMTAEMGELNGNEKYYYLSGNLPTSAYSPGTIRSGDMMLFGSNCLVLFYKTFSNSYSYTRIGSVDNASELETALGRGSATVKFELKNE